MSIKSPVLKVGHEYQNSSMNITSPTSNHKKRFINFSQGIFFTSQCLDKKSSSIYQYPKYSSIININTYQAPKLAIIATENRDEENSQQLYQLIKHFPFLSAINTQYPGCHFDDYAYITLCSKLKYKKYTSKKVLFHEGESPNGKVYLVYSGEIGIYKQKSGLFWTQGPELLEHDVLFNTPKLKRSTVEGAHDYTETIKRKKVNFLDNNNILHGLNTEGDNIDTSNFGELQTTFKAGDSFGEHTLFSWDASTITAVTRGTCELLVLNRRDFHEVRENCDNNRKKLTKFLHEFVPKFASVSTRDMIDKIVANAQERILERGTFLTTEGKSSDSIYIIYEGTCELIKNVRIDESSNLKDNLVSVKQFLRVGPAFTEPVIMCSVSKGTVLGEESVFDKEYRSAYFSSRVTSSHAAVFVIEKEAFVSVFPEAVKAELGELFKLKTKQYNQTLQPIISQKYPNMHILATQSSALLKKEVDTNLLLSPIVLGSNKNNNEINTKARTGIFRNDKAFNEEIPSFFRDRRIQAMKVSNEHKGKFRYKFPSNVQSQDKIQLQATSLTGEQIEKDREDEKSIHNTIQEQLHNVKLKICRTHVKNEFGIKGNYVNSSPALKNKNLGIRLINSTTTNMPSDCNYDDYYNNQTEFRNNNDYNIPLNQLELTERDDIRDTRRIFQDPMTPDGRSLSNISFGRVPQLKPIKIREAQTHLKAHTLEEIEDSFLKIKDSLTGRDTPSKKFLIAKKRLQGSKKSQCETERDLSMGKRIDVLLKRHQKKKICSVLPLLNVLQSTKPDSDANLMSCTLRDLPNFAANSGGSFNEQDTELEIDENDTKGSVSFGHSLKLIGTSSPSVHERRAEEYIKNVSRLRAGTEDFSMENTKEFLDLCL